VHRLAEVSTSIIDHVLPRGVPFARSMAVYLATAPSAERRVQRTFYAAGQTGQHYSLALTRPWKGRWRWAMCSLYARHEMHDVVIIDGKTRGIIARNLTNRRNWKRHFGHAVLLCTGGYGNVFYLSTNAMGCNVTASWKAHRKGAYFGNPCFTTDPPYLHPGFGDYQSKLTLMSESLRNEGRIWVPKPKRR